MKNCVNLLILFCIQVMAFGQTGTGVVLITDGSYQFTPTTVDSTSTFDFQLTNTVGVAQTVYFGGLSTPFALINNAPVEVAPQDTIDLSISFTPESTGTHSDTLEVIGGIFGSCLRAGSRSMPGLGTSPRLSRTPNSTPRGRTCRLLCLKAGVPAKCRGPVSRATRNERMV